MRSFVVRTMAIASTFGLSLMLGLGVASAADPYVGKTYSEASAAISKRGGTTVVATVSGSAVELDDCVVTSWAQSIFLDTDGSNSRSREYRLNLNCNNALASPGHPGNSVMTPEGTKLKKDQQAAANIEKNPEWCRKSEDILQWCIGICNSTGLCELES